MNCLRCGTEVQDGVYFCADCLSRLENQPVPNDVVPVLPRREEPISRRVNGKKRALSTEDKLAQTTIQLRKWRIFAGVLFVILVLLTAVCLFLLLKRRQPVLGQNYSTAGTSAAAGPLTSE